MAQSSVLDTRLPFAVTLQLATALLTKGSTFQVQLCLRWNVPDISVSVQQPHFGHPMTVQRGERSVVAEQ